MLVELRVENLLLIERAELRLAPGLNVLTGETGAGKTVLAQALDLLLGGRPKASIVRPGAREAYVEGLFALGGHELALPDGCALDDNDDPAEEITLARRVGADGRTRAHLNGRAATVADLRELAGELIAFYGQHEHRRLALSSAQLDILDAFCGPEQATRRGECAAALAQVRLLEREHARLAEALGERDRELAQLEHELAEIEQLA
ncbi:MAG: AAA family ATPase, partial [Solirubrobacterales bacterium]|nr:AAA family ATPase [Solirubrobacterales bacterium]